MKITAQYDGDSRRYHRYRIMDNRVTGTIYFPKGNEIPDHVVITTGEPEETTSMNDDMGNG